MKTKTIGTRFLAFALVAAACLASPQARANGFYIQEMTASGLAQANATIAAGANPSSQYTNAANLSYLKGFWFEAGLTAYVPVGSYENPVTGEKTSYSSAVQPVPCAFASYRINDWLAVGLAEFTNFGLAIEWPDKWEGNHKVIKSSIQTFTLAPVHAHILLLGWVSLAMAGVVYHLYPAASETRLAKAHFWIHNLVLPPFMVVLAAFLTGTKAAGPVLGIASVVMIVGLACFMVNVLTNAKPAG